MEKGKIDHIPNPEPPKKTVVAGSRGRMGSMLLKRALMAGLDAVGMDLPYDQKSISAGCANADMVLLCVPARNLGEVGARLTKFMHPEAILSDITSVKVRPMRQMEKLWPGNVVGTHPLFGPEFDENADLPVAITAGKNCDPKATAQVKAFFDKLGFRAFETTAENHDKAMAKIQNMNFITNLAYFAALSEQKDLLPFITPSFERRRKAAAKMLTEDAEMFGGLFEANPYSHEAVRQFRKMLNLAASGEIDLLTKRAQWWWKNKIT